MGRGALGVAQRPVPLLVGSAAVGVSRWREITETAVRSDGVVVVFPERQSLAGVGERAEQRFVQQLISKAAVEALDEGILLWLATRFAALATSVV